MSTYTWPPKGSGGGGGSGTVTSVSVVSSNGFAGSVANATTTPTITLRTTLTAPVLAGNGTALIAATTTGTGSTVVLSVGSVTSNSDITNPTIRTNLALRGSGSGSGTFTLDVTNQNLVVDATASPAGININSPNGLTLQSLAVGVIGDFDVTGKVSFDNAKLTSDGAGYLTSTGISVSTPSNNFIMTSGTDLLLQQNNGSTNIYGPVNITQGPLTSFLSSIFGVSQNYDTSSILFKVAANANNVGASSLPLAVFSDSKVNLGSYSAAGVVLGVNTNPTFFTVQSDAVDFQVDSVSKFKIDYQGNITLGALGAGVLQSSSAGLISSTAPGTVGNVLTSNGTAWVSMAGGGGGGSGTVTSFVFTNGSNVTGTVTNSTTTPTLSLAPTGSTIVASAFASWDANRNLSANAIIPGYTTTATAGGTTTLVVGSTQLQYFTGSLNQTVLLPVASTLALGESFEIVNLNSSGTITVESSGGGIIALLATGRSATFTCILTSGTGLGSWHSEFGMITGNSGILTVAGGGTGVSTLSNFTAAGTDGIVVTGGTAAVIAATSIAQHVADATHNGYLSSTDWNTFNSKQPAGTYVTSLTIASSNGFAGSSSGGATPALTISTTVTGIIKGNGTAISAATSGTDYSAGTSALATGILKSTTATGVLSIAIAADFPTLNQSTTGNAATATAPASGTAHGVAVLDGSGNFTSVAPSSSGNVLTSNGTDWVSSTPSTGGTVTSFVFTNGANVTGTVTNSTTTPTLSLAPTSSTPAVSSFASWDSSKNLSAAGFLLNGSSSGVISILPQAAAGTYNFNLPTTAGTSGQVLTSQGGAASAMTWTTPATGTVTAVSIASANGFAGSSSGGATPALTISTSINSPVLAGNGTAISAAATTGSGSTVVLSTAPAITGAWTLTDAGTIINAATASKVLAFSLAGMSSSTTLTLSSSQSTSRTLNIPNIAATDTLATLGLAQTFTAALTLSAASTALTVTNSATIGTLSLTNALTVPNGGSGAASFTAYSVICAGTTSTGNFQNVSGVGTSGQILTSNGAGALPTWQTAGGGSGTVTSFAFTNGANVTGTVTNSTTTPTLSLAPTGTAISAGNFAAWDANSNLAANNHFNKYTTTVTSGSTVTLSVASSFNQYFTGTTAQTVKMPDATTMVQTGAGFRIVNNSNQTMTIQDNSAGAIQSLFAGGQALVTVTNIGSAAGTWELSTLGSFIGWQGDGVLFSSTIVRPTVSGSGTNILLNPSNQTGNVFYCSVATGGSAAPSFRKIAATDFVAANTNNNWIQNFGLATSVSANAMTITTKQNDGSTNQNTGASASSIGFRSATSTSGAYTVVSITSANTLTIPSGASLGQTSAMNQYVWVYLLNNAGSAELAVSGVKLFDDFSIQSTTAIGAGSTSGTVMYSTSARSNVPVRLVGRLLVNETTAGTWASNATEVSNVQCKPQPTVTGWGETSWTPTGAWSTNTTYTGLWRRVGDTFEGQVKLALAGAPTAASLTVTVPFTIDTTKIVNNTALGQPIFGSNAGGLQGGTSYGFQCLYNSSTSVALVYNSSLTGTSVNSPVNATSPVVWANTDAVTLTFSVPIAGWSTYGP